IIEEGETKKVNMANLAIVGSHKVNGVSALHSELLKTQVFRDFFEMDPEKFTNKTNGITPRRWLKTCNSALAALITEYIGSDWVRDLGKLEQLINFERDSEFCNSWRTAKLINKEKLAKVIFAEQEIRVNPDTLFDCHVKRIHEYKRQLLNILRVIYDYNCIKDNPNGAWVPRTIIFSGKAAPGYFLAKRIIKLITSVANVINHDKAVNDRLKVV